MTRDPCVILSETASDAVKRRIFLRCFATLNMTNVYALILLIHFYLIVFDLFSLFCYN